MRHFTSALVLVSGAPADPALQHAGRIAQAQRTIMTVVDVLEPAPAYLRPLLPRGWELPKLLRAQKMTSLERTAANLQRRGIKSRVKLLEGSPVKVLVREVARAHHDLLVVAALAPGMVPAAGTTAARLVRECPCPTLLARPSRRRRHRVLVAIDARPRDRRSRTMSTRLLETGLAMAEVGEEDLHVLHVWELPDQRYLRRQGLRADEMKRFVVRAQEEAREALERTLASSRRHLPATHVHLERGTPRTVIPTFALKHGIDLLVIGTVGRAGLARHLIGNTAEVLLGEMPCSMLVVRPGAPGTTRP